MVLRVEFERFADTCKKLLQVEDAFVTSRGDGSMATAAAPGKELIVAAVCRQSAGEVTKALEGAGMKVSEGEWSPGGEGWEINEVGCDLHVGAVAYNSKESKPGLWVDAFAEPRTHTQVLRAMFDELRENGELDEMSFEEFVRLANPNVVVLAPTDLTRFVEHQTDCT